MGWGFDIFQKFAVKFPAHGQIIPVKCNQISPPWAARCCQISQGWSQERHNKNISNQLNPTSGLLSVLRSDWFSYYQAIRYSPLVAKSAGFLAKASFNQLNLFSIVLANQLDFTKTIIPLALMASESIAHDSEPIRARGIIVKQNSAIFIYITLLYHQRYNLLQLQLCTF